MDNYSVEKPLSAEEWNALDEGERVRLVALAHERTRAQTGGSPEAHAALHVVVENRLAEGHDVVVRAYERFRAAGVNRHNTIHALASVASRHLLAVMESRAPLQADADADYDALDPAAFTKKR